MGVCGAICVVYGVVSVVVLKVRAQVREGRLDCASNQWLRVSGSTVFASANTDRKASDQSDPLRYGKPIKEGVSFEVHPFQPGQPPLPCSVAVFVCLVLHAVESLNLTSVQVIHEEISVGSGDIRKFVGICVDKFCFKKNISSAMVRKNQRESISAITLYFPF